MKVLFIGTVDFSATALRELISMRVDIVGVCTKSVSTFNSDYADLAPIAAEAGIPVHFTKDINCSESLSWIKSKTPDVIFCFGWSELIRLSLLRLPPLGVIGFHPAALPANRGRHPLIWALALGLTVTASTFFFMDEGVDSGDLLSQEMIRIDPEDDARTLYAKVSTVAREQIRSFVPLLASGKFVRIPQELRSTNVWRKRTAADGCIDWRMSAQSICNLVRALTRPYVGAHFVYRGQEVKVWKASCVENAPENFEPGKVMSMDACGVRVKAGIGGVLLKDIEPRVSVREGEYL